MQGLLTLANDHRRLSGAEGVRNEAGRDGCSPPADSDGLRFPPIFRYLIPSAGTYAPAGQLRIFPLGSIVMVSSISIMLFTGP
jgi:hypothetical protein